MDSGNPKDADNLAALVEEFREYMDPWVKKDKEEVDMTSPLNFINICRIGTHYLNIQ